MQNNCSNDNYSWIDWDNYRRQLGADDLSHWSYAVIRQKGVIRGPVCHDIQYSMAMAKVKHGSDLQLRKNNGRAMECLLW